MSFPEWDTVNRDALVLPIRGKKYRIPALGYLDEIKIRGSAKATEQITKLRREEKGDLDKLAELQSTLMSDEEFLKALLGDQLARMRKNNVPPSAITHAAAVAHTDAVHGRAAAEYVWKSGLDPKALETAIREVVAEISTPSTPSPSSESASETPSPASTRPTTSPTNTPPATPATPSTSKPSSPTSDT